MGNHLQIIEIEGKRVEVLFTPSLFTIVQRNKWDIKVDTENLLSIQSGYIKLLYCAIINAYEVNKFDNPEYPNPNIKLIDVEVWATQNAQRLNELIEIFIQSITNKSITENAQEIKKKKKKSWFRSLLTMKR